MLSALPRLRLNVERSTTMNMKLKRAIIYSFIILATAAVSCVIYEKWLQEVIYELLLRSHATPARSHGLLRLPSSNGSFVAEIESYETSKYDETLRESIKIRRSDSTNEIFSADFFSQKGESSLVSNVIWATDGEMSFTKLPASAFINRNHRMPEPARTATDAVKKMTITLQ